MIEFYIEKLRLSRMQDRLDHIRLFVKSDVFSLGVYDLVATNPTYKIRAHPAHKGDFYHNADSLKGLFGEGKFNVWRRLKISPSNERKELIHEGGILKKGKAKR